MNIRPMHHLFADDMWSIEHGQLTDEEKAILNAEYTPADRYEAAGRAILNTVQGRPEQAWTPRRCSPEMAAEIQKPACGFEFGQDRLPEAHEREEDAPKPALSPAESWTLVGIYVLSAGVAGWFVALLLAFFGVLPYAS